MPFISHQVVEPRSKNHAKQLVKLEEPMSEVEPEPEVEQNELSSESLDNKDVNQGKWTQSQNLKFVIFVHFHQDIFNSKHKRKVCKIFRSFSEYLDGRTAAQCRSHYQKIMIKFKTIAKLKRSYKSLFGEAQYKKEFQNFKEAWGNTHPVELVNYPEFKEFKEFAIQTDQLSCQCQQSSSLPVTDPAATMLNFNQYLYWSQMNQYLPMENQGNNLYWPSIANLFGNPSPQSN